MPHNAAENGPVAEADYWFPWRDSGMSSMHDPPGVPLTPGRDALAAAHEPEVATPLAPVSEEAAREIINGWARRGWFRLRNMGDKIFVGRLAPSAAYAIRLQTHYEDRTVRQAEEPYSGGRVDDRQRPPDPWDVPVRPPTEFEQRVERLTIPGTERVQMCGACAGQGRVVCGQCNGQGQMACPRCGGRGVLIEQVIDRAARDTQPNYVQRARTVERRCTCAAGRVRCSACHGNGRLTCSGCRGSGKTKSFEQLIVRFQAATQGELLDQTPVPDRWLGSLSGDVVADRKDRQIDACDPIAEHVDRKVRELLAQSHAIDASRARILLQTLRIERIPLVEVDYKYAGVERRLWLCGHEQEVYAPKAPWHRQRFLWLVAAGIAVAAAAIAAVAYYFLPGPWR